MTDEQLVEYLDTAQGRLAQEQRAAFSASVEAARAGTIFAHDQKQYDRWRRDVERHTGERAQGRDLAQLVRDLGGSSGGLQVVAGEFEFRN